jgi:hypothetical protein
MIMRGPPEGRRHELDEGDGTMRTGSKRRTAAGVLSALGLCLAAGLAVAAEGVSTGTPGAQGPGQGQAGPAAQAQTVEITLEDFVARVLANHPDLDFASPTTAPAAAPRPSPVKTAQTIDHPVSGRPALPAPLMVRQPKTAAAAAASEARLRETVETVVYQAVEAYWDQVRRQGTVKICKAAVARAAETTRRFQGNPDVGASAAQPADTSAGTGTVTTAADVSARTAETWLLETRIALAQARRHAGEGQDRLKLLLNDDSISVESDTRLVLVTEPVDPPTGSSMDLEVGMDTAAYVRLDPTEDRRDKAARRKYETVAMEVKRAYRQSAVARTLFALACDRAAAAQKTLDADDAASGLAASPRPAGANGAGAAANGTGAAVNPAASGGAAANAAAGSPGAAPGTRRRSVGDALLLRLRAEASLAEAERQILSARTDYQTAQTAWQRTTGELLDEWNISLQTSK